MLTLLLQFSQGEISSAGRRRRGRGAAEVAGRNGHVNILHALSYLDAIIITHGTAFYGQPGIFLFVARGVWNCSRATPYMLGGQAEYDDDDEAHLSTLFYFDFNRACRVMYLWA
jgi:hypothetical protein